MTDLKNFLLANNGKPSGMTWFDVAEKFDIHVLEGKYENVSKWKEARADKVRFIWRRMKKPIVPIKNLKVKSVWEQRTKNGKTELLYSYGADYDTDTFIQGIEETIKNSLKDVTPIPLRKEDIGNKTLFIPLSDIHIGALGSDFLNNNTYNKEVIENRLTKVLNVIFNAHCTYGRFQRIMICDLGDALDGYNKRTTRGGHELEQIMGNREQFDTYFCVFKKFFDNLVSLNLANKINYVALSNNNHGGSFEYTAQRAIEIYLNSKYPDIDTNCSDKFIVSFKCGDHVYHLTHGKDDTYMKRGLPLSLNDKTEVYFQRHIEQLPFDGKYHTIVKGDLHQQLDQRGYKFRYLSCPSFFGGTNYIHYNYGPNRPGIVYDIIDCNKKEIIKGELLF